MNSSRLTAPVAALALATGVALGASGTAGAVPDLAKSLTKAKVSAIAKREAAAVLDQRAPSLQVAAARTAVTAETAETAELADLAANAQSLGGKPAADFLSESDIGGSSGIQPSCNPTSTTYVLCLSLHVPATRASRLMLVSQVPVDADSTAGAKGACRLVLDGQLVWTVDVAAGGSDGGFTLVPGEVLTPGAHVLQQQCNEQGGDLRLENTSLSVVVFPVTG